MTNILAIKALEANKEEKIFHKEEVDRFEYWLRTQFSNPKEFYTYEEDLLFIKNNKHIPVYERNKISIMDAFNKAEWAIKTDSQIAKIRDSFDDCVKYFISVFQQKTVVYNLNQFLNDYN